MEIIKVFFGISKELISCLYCTPEHLFLPLRRALLPTLSLCRRTLPSFCTPASLFSSSSAGIPPYFVSLPADISLFCTPVSLLSSSSAGIPSHFVSSSAGIFLFLHAGSPVFFFFDGHFSLLCLFAGGHFPLFARRFLYFLPLRRAFLPTFSLLRRTFPSFCTPAHLFSPSSAGISPYFYHFPADTSLFLHAGFSTFFLLDGHFSLLFLFSGRYFPLLHAGRISTGTIRPLDTLLPRKKRKNCRFAAAPSHLLPRETADIMYRNRLPQSPTIEILAANNNQKGMALS